MPSLQNDGRLVRRGTQTTLAVALGLLLFFVALMWSHGATFMSLTDHEVRYYLRQTPPGASILCPGSFEANGILVQWFYQRLWTGSDWSFSAVYQRLPMLLAALLALGAQYMLGLKAGGRGVALGAAFLLAVNTLFLNEAVHCRFYMPNLLAVCLATLFLLQMLRQGDLRWAVLYALAAALCVGTMMLSLAVIGIHFLFWCLDACRDWKRVWVFLPALLTGLLLLALDYQGWQRFNYGAYNSREAWDVVRAFLLMGAEVNGEQSQAVWGATLAYWNYWPAISAVLVALLGGWFGVLYRMLKRPANHSYVGHNRAKGEPSCAIEESSREMGEPDCTLAHDSEANNSYSSASAFWRGWCWSSAALFIGIGGYWLASAWGKNLLNISNLTPLLPILCLALAFPWRFRWARWLMLALVAAVAPLVCHGSWPHNLAPSVCLCTAATYVRPGDMLMISDTAAGHYLSHHLEEWGWRDNLPEVKLECGQLGGFLRQLNGSVVPDTVWLIDGNDTYKLAQIIAATSARRQVWFIAHNALQISEIQALLSQPALREKIMVRPGWGHDLILFGVN